MCDKNSHNEYTVPSPLKEQELPEQKLHPGNPKDGLPCSLTWLVLKTLK